MALLRSRRLRAAVPAALSAMVAACGNPTEIKANLPVADAAITTYSLNGSPTSLPAAVLLVDHPRALRVTSDYSFDFAVDIGAGGSASILPVDLVASAAVLGASRRVGFQASATAFDDITKAPVSGYTFQQPVPIAVGDVGIIESLNHPYCSGAFLTSPTIYAKYQVIAIDAVARTASFRILVDPNCGFRGFESGTPSR